MVTTIDPDRPPAISVLMTVYNRADFLAEAIESVLAQTWTDFELVIVDDCSPDDSVAVATRYTNDPRVRVVRNTSNLGDYGNRNLAASLARGEFMKYHDSDDIMYAHCLESMIVPLQAEPDAQFALTASRAWPGAPVPFLLDPRLSFEREFLGAGLFNGGPANGLFRTAFFRELGGFEDIGAGSDHLFWLRACAVAPVVLVHSGLFYYRIHAGQEIASDRASRSYAELHARVWRYLMDERVPLDDAALRQARTNWLFVILRYALRDIRNGEFNIAALRLRRARLSVGHLVRYLRRPRRLPYAGTPPHPKRIPES